METVEASPTMAYHRLDPHLLLRPILPAPLGRDGAWLPVVHATALISPGGDWWRSLKSHVARERGLWFYYAAGCSDLFYDAGRTLAARNRVDAAVQIAERLGLGGAAYVAAWINATLLQAGRGKSSLYKPRYLHALGDGGGPLIQRLEAVVKEAARWPFYPNTLNSSNSSSEGCDSNSCHNAQSSGRRRSRRGRQAPIARAANYVGARVLRADLCEHDNCDIGAAARRMHRHMRAARGGRWLFMFMFMFMLMFMCIHTHNTHRHTYTHILTFLQLSMPATL